jgi:uncharacterized coiled-coil protein SlyX
MNIKRLNLLHTVARRGFFLLPLALAWFALSPTARTADGGLPNQNTAEGHDALSSLTTGANNTAVGFDALFSITDGSEDTATGSLALANDTGGFNTAYGFAALNANTTGILNTATGRNALLNNTTGVNNTADGSAALSSNTTGNFNVATGRVALSSNTTGSGNTANGFASLSNNTTGEQNTANGVVALFNNTSGNTNIALGFQAGFKLTTGSNNIDIGAEGQPAEANTIRIGKVGVQKIAYMQGISGATIAGGVAVIIDTKGHLGTVTSSERFKDQIKPMDKASEAIFSLKPVTFRYKHDLDPEGISQFGLVAEQVEKVNPTLVARDAQGKVYTVRYEAVNSMLLNEFLKEHRKVEEQEATITQVKSTVANQETTIVQQQKEIKALTASLKEQASQIQKVSDQLELSKPALQVALNNQ